MRGISAATAMPRGSRGALPRRLLSAAELFDVLAGADYAQAVNGTAWRELRLIDLSLRGSGEATLPPAAFYSLLGSEESIAAGNPGRSVHFRWTKPQRATLLCIEPRMLRAAAAECGLGSAQPELRGGAEPTDPVCERLLGALAEEAKIAAYPLQELIVESIANALAYRLVTRADAAGTHAAAARGALNLKAFREVSAYIDRHIDERLSLDELARVAGVSRFHFARQFRLRTGESPMGFLLRARIERAKSQLNDGGGSIGAVAASLGFADQSHFTRTFKRLVGVPPSDYKGGGRGTSVLAPRLGRTQGGFDAVEQGVQTERHVDDAAV